MLTREFLRAKGIKGRKDWGPTGVSFFNAMKKEIKNNVVHTWNLTTNCTWY